MAQSVIQQNQAGVSVIQSTALQTVQVGKSGNVIFLKGSPNSVIQSAASGTLQGVQVVETESSEDSDPGRKQQRQILVRRPSYRKILNDLSGSEITVIPASSLQLASSGADTLHTIAMSTAASSAGTIVHYNTGGSEPQFIVPVGSGDLSGLKFTSSGGLAQGVVLAAAAPTTTSSNSSGSLHGGDGLGEEANRKREVRLLKNREAARECRAKKKKYINCLENRVAVLENQNKALIEELKTLKALYCQNS